jgi:chorismate dehydratase
MRRNLPARDVVGRDSVEPTNQFPRIGCVKYLNARPLIRGWPGDAEFDHPSALCKKLSSGEIDIALVSSFEFLRNPVYRIVDDISISSAGPVYSVVLAHLGEISEIKEIELDPASETSVNLLRCLLAEVGLNPRLVLGSTGCQPVIAGSLPATRSARLLIGDQAIRFRREHANKFRFWDLGEQWNKLVGLPFVYALWLIRPEIRSSKSLADRLRRLRDENLTNIDELVAEEKEFGRDFCRRYYREHLRFSFGEKEKKGLREFYKRCVSLRLLGLDRLALGNSKLEIPLHLI